MQQNRMNIGALAAAALLVFAVFAGAAAPTASAHYCTSRSDECDPNGCVEGEYHDHTRQRLGPDERCRTEKEEPEPKPGRCDDKPLIEKLICIIIGGQGTAEGVVDTAQHL